MAGREHAISIAIAAVAGEPRHALDAVIGAQFVSREQLGTRRGNDRIAQRGAASGAKAPLAAGAAKARAAAVTEEALAREGLVHHPKDRLTRAAQADQRAPGRKPGDEGAGAVDRVEHPDVIRVLLLGPEFLPDDPMGREAALDELAHGGLPGPVGLR